VLPASSFASQLSASSELQGAVYPREPVERPAIATELRGWSSIEFDGPLGKNVEFNGDFLVYGSNHRRALFDGEARIVWRGKDVALAAGLLRERWGRFDDSALNPLGPANTPFSLVHPERQLSQPAIRATVSVAGVSVDGYALIGQRRQPIPDNDGRFGFGVATRDVVHRGTLGDQALGVRVSRTALSVDWAVHAFGGLSRRPTFVPRFTPDARLAGIDADYREIVQVGGEVETTRADWRFLAEGFGRGGAVDVTGRERTYVSVAGAAEYQRLGALGGAYNFIPRFEVLADSRGDRADIPFGSAVRAGIRIAQAQRLPAQVDLGYSYDWAFRGHGLLAGVEKALAESPTVSIGFRLTAMSAGTKPGVLNIWRDDLELFSFVRVGLSR